MGVLRLVLSEIHNKEKEKQAKGLNPILDDDETTAVLQKEAKKRNESIGLFRKGGREDLAKKEEDELVVIGSYLPEPLSEEEINSVLDGLMGKGLNDFNSLMKEAMREFKGRADGAIISGLVRKKLGG